MDDTHTYNIMMAKIRAYRETRRVISECLEPYDVTITEWLLLGAVLQARHATMGELALALDVKLPLVSRYVKELEQRGLVSVHAGSDKRSKHVSATRLGEKRMQQIDPVVKTTLKQWLQHIPSEDIRVYIRVLMNISA